MESQIDEAESKLPHLRVRGAKSFRALHFLEEIVGNRLSRLIMPREHVERLAFPAPVFHDLRRKFDEIPSDARPRETANLHAAEQVMQQVAEFVEDRLDLAMRKQRRRAVHR